MVTRAEVIEAIEAAWSSESSAHAEWSATNPALGQCEVASFVAWEHLGGELVLGRVMVDGEQTEYHYWNRIDGQDLDLTREQFVGDEVIEELSALDNDTIMAQRNSMLPELVARVDLLRQAVNLQLLG